MKVAAVVLLLCTACVVPPKRAYAQDSSIIRKGTWDMGVWTAGGHSAVGGTEATGVFSAGFRIGRVLTADHGKGWYRGNIEYAADAIPLTFVFQPGVRIVFSPPGAPPSATLISTRETVYGGGITPFVVKWNFTGHRKFAPYFETGGGILVTTSDVPVFTYKLNFTPQAALGTHIFTGEKRSVTLDLRYVHISNAGLAFFNPGINTIQAGIGYHWFR